MPLRDIFDDYMERLEKLRGTVISENDFQRASEMINLAMKETRSLHHKWMLKTGEMMKALAAKYGIK